MRVTPLHRISRLNIQDPLTHGFMNNLSGGYKTQKTDIKLKEIHVSIASNGARIVSQDQDGPMAAVGIYCNGAGAKYDPINKPGLNYVLRWALMTSNLQDSMFQLDRQVRSLGGSIEHQEIRKQYLGWKVEVRRDQFVHPFQIMNNCITVPRFPDHELTRYRDTMDAVLEELRWQSPREYAVHQLEQVAFYKEPCGNARYVPPTHNDDISTETLAQQWATRFIPKNIIIAGVNVDHNALVSAYESNEFRHGAEAPHFREAQITGAATPKELDQYQGGREDYFQEKRYKEMSTKPWLENETICAVGWKTKGYDNLHEYATSLIVQQLIDILLEDGLRVPFGIDNGVRSFYSPFGTVGLVGVTIRTPPNQSNETLYRTMDKVHISAVEGNFKSAVTRACVRFLNDAVELRRDYIDFLATNVSEDAKLTRTVNGTLEAIRKVTFGEVQAALKQSLGCQPCLYATGDTSYMPSVRQLVKN